MTAINSLLAGMNTPVADAYLRNLHEFRVKTELSLLPIINYLVAQSENGEVLLPTRLLEHEREFLQKLANRYHKRSFTFIFDENSDDPAYYALSRLIHKAKKMVSYCLNDLYDLLHESGLALKDLNIHANILLVTQDVADTYHKQVPLVIKDQLRQIGQRTVYLTDQPARKAKKKYADTFQLYASVLQEVKQAIDFELLKLYDFCLETKQDVLKSDALLEILPTIQKLGEEEYVKRPFTKQVLPLGEKRYDEEHIFLEEWSSNLRRALELKTLLAHDFRTYLSQNPHEAENVSNGSFPELQALLESVF